MIQTLVNYLRKNKGYSEKTCEEYKKDLRTIAKYMKNQRAEVRWSTIEKSDIDRMVETWSESGLKPATIKRRISALRTLYVTAMALGYQGKNPAQWVSTPKRGNQIANIVDLGAIRTAIAAQSNDSETRAALSVMTETGVRLSEFQNITKEDINETSRSIRVKGKGNRERIVYFGNMTAAAIADGWPKETTHSSDREVRRKVHFALSGVTDGRQLSPHVLRHTYASEMIMNGASLETTRVLLGHQSILTTQKYLTIADSHRAAEYNKFKPNL